MIAAKKKPIKGTLSITVSGSGSYTVKGKGFRKTGTASKSYKVKPGVYTVKAPTGSVTPGKAKVRKGKAARVTVTFRTVPDTPTPTDPQPTQNPPVPTPTPPPSPTPTPTQTPTGVIGPVKRVNTDVDGAQANDDLNGGDWSPDGSQVLFETSASNLVPNDTNGTSDLFVKTLATGAIQRVNTDAAGGQANNYAWSNGWSPDGSQVLFETTASNLVPNDTNGTSDLFVKTVATGAIQRVSASAAGNQGNDRSRGGLWSPDGTRILFESNASNLTAAGPATPGHTNGVNPNLTDLFVKTLATGAVQRINTDAAGNPANNHYGDYGADWSPDGTKVLFQSKATNLVPGGANAQFDWFVKTLATGAIQRVNTDAAGTQANTDLGHVEAAWSPDNTRVAFSSDASNLVPGDTNGQQDLFVKTLASGAIVRVNTDAAGIQANWEYGDWEAEWPDDTHVAFTSHASNLVPGVTGGRFLKTLATGAIQHIDAGDRSPDGTKVLFSSSDAGLVPDDTNGKRDLFVKTIATGEIRILSTDAAGGQANGDVYYGDWSPDGSQVLFSSAATNLVPGDTNGLEDLFVKTLG